MCFFFFCSSTACKHRNQNPTHTIRLVTIRKCLTWKSIQLVAFIRTMKRVTPFDGPNPSRAYRLSTVRVPMCDERNRNFPGQRYTIFKKARNVNTAASRLLHLRNIMSLSPYITIFIHPWAAVIDENTDESCL